MQGFQILNYKGVGLQILQQDLDIANVEERGLPIRPSWEVRKLERLGSRNVQFAGSTLGSQKDEVRKLKNVDSRSIQ